jgi:quinol monooxygenase YgiN
MTCVVTYLDVQPDSTTEAIVLLGNYREASRVVENFETSVVQETCRPNRFAIVEIWKDESLFQAHENTAHVAEFRSRLQAIHNSPYDQRVHHDFAVASVTEQPASESLWVITHVDVPPPRRDETEVLLKRLAEQSRTDEGYQRYDVLQQNAPRTNHFTVVAVWTSEKAFASNAMKPHTRQFRGDLGPMLGAPYDERLYRQLR